jgi:hypothetical protein
VLILEGTHSAEVKEQALCILANIGDGESAKEYIMANEDVLKKLTDYMVHSVTAHFHIVIWTFPPRVIMTCSGATVLTARPVTPGFSCYHL